MFYKKSFKERPESVKDFKYGPGFYWVTITEKSLVTSEFYYVNYDTYFFLGKMVSVHPEIIALFNEKEEKASVVDDLMINVEELPVLPTPQDKLTVSEDFVLRLVAVSKMNGQNAKLSDILKG